MKRKFLFEKPVKLELTLTDVEIELLEHCWGNIKEGEAHESIAEYLTTNESGHLVGKVFMDLLDYLIP